MITVTCPACQTRFGHDEESGADFRDCPKCGISIEFVKTPRAVSDAATEPTEPVREERARVSIGPGRIQTPAMQRAQAPTYVPTGSSTASQGPSGDGTAKRRHALFTRLLAADERRLPVTVLIALALVGWLAVMLQTRLSQDTWFYQFFFKRSFVQWVLLSAFSIGFVHVLRRIPEWYRERKALKILARDGVVKGERTLVERRWLQIEAARADPERGNHGHFAKTLADHDEAEIDAAYRLSTDIVQILPLIGFFGTVFGLSHGLYQSFLATGGTTTKDFAKSIAVAFDNTLLGLALTIILFAIQSVLRKREEGLLLELNLQASVAAESSQESQGGNGQFKAAVMEFTNALQSYGDTLFYQQEQLVAARAAVVSPVRELAEELKQEAMRGISALRDDMSKQNEAATQRCLQSFSEQLEKIAAELLEGIDQKVREQHAALPSALVSLELAVKKAAAIAQEHSINATSRDANLVASLSGTIDVHTRRLKEEIRRPRTIHFVETADGQTEESQP